MAHHIAIYGKGGVGKTTLASNLSAAFAETGRKVVLVGCDPKCDSATLLLSGEAPPSVIELIASGERISIGKAVVKGYRGIACIELGDPFHTGECASREIGRASELLRELDVFGQLAPDLVLYDLPGDAGCFGLSNPVGISPVQQTLVVTSADVMSLYTANSFFMMLGRQRDGIRIPGALIANGLNGPFEESLVDDFARQVNSRVIGAIARSLVVKQCELYGKTVIEAAPLSNLAYGYRRLARHIIDENVISSLPAPIPLKPEDLKTWARSWGDRIHELEHGIIRDGAGI